MDGGTSEFILRAFGFVIFISLFLFCIYQFYLPGEGLVCSSLHAVI